MLFPENYNQFKKVLQRNYYITNLLYDSMNQVVITKPPVNNIEFSGKFSFEAIIVSDNKVVWELFLDGKQSIVRGNNKEIKEKLDVSTWGSGDHVLKLRVFFEGQNEPVQETRIVYIE